MKSTITHLNHLESPREIFQMWGLNEHSCQSPPIGGDRLQKNPANRWFFKKLEGKFGGDIWGVRGGEILVILVGNDQKFPPQVCWEPKSEKIQQVWGETAQKCSFPPNLGETKHIISPPKPHFGHIFWWFGCLVGFVPSKSEQVGGTLVSPQIWGGHLGGTQSALGGKFF